MIKPSKDDKYGENIFYPFHQERENLLKEKSMFKRYNACLKGETYL